MSEVEDIVRLRDRDRYLSTFFAPDDKRPHLLALYAFNAEILKVRNTVSEPNLGMIRLQWWRDTIEGIYAGNPVPGYAVAEALARGSGWLTGSVAPLRGWSSQLKRSSAVAARPIKMQS